MGGVVSSLMKWFHKRIEGAEEKGLLREKSPVPVVAAAPRDIEIASFLQHLPPHLQTEPFDAEGRESDAKQR